jgi:hypothetical protein
MRIRKLTQVLLGSLMLALSLTVGFVRAQAQPRPASAQVPEIDDEQKVNLYTRFSLTYSNPATQAQAYETAKAYLQKYAKDNDQYSKYVQEWVVIYEKQARQDKLRDMVYGDRNFVDSFKLGKQVLADEPDYLDALIALGNAGLLSFRAGNESFNAEAIGYAKRAIQQIESGKTPEDWKPFKGKTDTLAYLYSIVGLLKLKSAPAEAIEPLIRSTQFDSDLKKDPFNYAYLGRAYQAGPYAKLSADYQKNFAGKEESPASKAELEKLNAVIDRMIDAYARSVAAAGADTKDAQIKKTSMDQLTLFYKFRHQNSDAGLTELIAGVLSKPLPLAP